MNLNQIHSFLAVSKTLNFTAAARQLGVPQSTISRQISDLETRLGVRLFYRTKRDVQLTDEGRLFLPYAQEISDAARKAAYAVKQIHEGSTGTLSIASAAACREILSKALAVFHESYPDINVNITPLSGGESLLEDTDAPHDFWFLYRDAMSDPENFDYVPTHREPLCLARRAKAGRKKKQDPAGKMPDPSVLSSEKFILLSEETDPILYMNAVNYCRTHRFTPKIINTFEDISSVLLSVGAGLGVSILPASLASGAGAEDIDTVLLGDDSYSIDCIAAWKPSLLNPAAELFLKVLRGVL